MIDQRTEFHQIEWLTVRSHKQGTNSDDFTAIWDMIRIEVDGIVSGIVFPTHRGLDAVNADNDGLRYWPLCQLERAQVCGEPSARAVKWFDQSVEQMLRTDSRLRQWLQNPL